MCINFNYYLLFILHAFTCTVAYFIFVCTVKKYIYIYIYILCSLRELAMTMAVKLRMTAITGVLELRSRLNPSGQLVVYKSLQSCHKRRHRVFMCTIRRNIIKPRMM